MNQPVKYSGINNITTTLISSFLKGEEMGVSLCERILTTFDLTPQDYMEVVKDVKADLSMAEKFHHDGVLHVTMPEQASDKKKAVVVRLLNIIHGTNNVIVVDASIVYIPEVLTRENIADIEKQVNENIQAFRQLDYLKSKVALVRNKLKVIRDWRYRSVMTVC